MSKSQKASPSEKWKNNKHYWRNTEEFCATVFR